jgi:DNA-binding NarL/FixJ family response regulator
MDVLLVDDHPLIHETLATAVLKVVPNARIHIESDLAGALMRAHDVRDLRLVLLDLGLPGCNGIDALIRLRKALTGARVVIISAIEDSYSVHRAFDAGAAGYVPKSAPPHALVDALRVVMEGGTYVPAQAGEAPRKTASMAALGLTGRQADVLKLVAKGLPNSEIARRLDISENTVKQHAHSAYRLLGVSSRTEAMVLLARLGIRDN